MASSPYAGAPGRLPTQADVVVVGAGIVGAACAYYAARAGLRVAVVERAAVAAGTTGAGEGNLLISDKLPGPELDLMAHSLRLWPEIADACDTDFELEPKGGVVVASSAAGLASLRDLGAAQRARGVQVVDVDSAGLTELEPHLVPDLPGGAWYPQDRQVQPALAAAALLRLAIREHGVRVHTGVTVVGIGRGRGERVTSVQTSRGRIATPAVVNAAGVWSPEVARLAGLDLPVLPRRGFILVTQRLPDLVRHKVYAAEYLASVVSDDAALQVAPVVESTRSGTVLIGSSRERVGFERRVSLPALRRIAAEAVKLFPVLAGVAVIRAYQGLRPYSPDNLPLIGPDPRLPGLFHATGHEGAGIGLAPATGELIAAIITGAEPPVDPTPFRPERFAEVPADGG